MCSELGKNIKYTIFGESHGTGIGVVIEGLPVGTEIKENRIADFMRRRAPGNAPWATPRKEEDEVKILSGVFNGKTCGTPLCAIIGNENAHSKDYQQEIPRPGHADFPAHIKYKGFEDFRGGGHFSGRITAPLCFAGAIAKDILAEKDIFIGAHIAAIGDVMDRPFDSVNITKDDLLFPEKMGFPVNNAAIGETMQAKIMLAKKEKDSVGGIIEGCAIGLPVGLGEPMVDTLEGDLAKAAFAIPAVKGVEFGAGFDAARKKGSQNNDDFILENGKIRTKTNHHGGILGGISTGMPIIMRVAIKPTPSIGKEQQTVNLKTMEEMPLIVEGRHDPCIVPRAVPVLEAVMALTLLDHYIESRKTYGY